MDCPWSSDDRFGPQYCNHFDFTLVFEQSILQIAPSTLLILLLPLRVFQLRRQDVKTIRTRMRTVKQSAIALLVAVQLALLVAWSVAGPAYRTSTTIPATVLSFVASLVLLYLSGLEHTRSIRPSSTINTYLFFSLLFDLPQGRTLWLRSVPNVIPAFFMASLGLRVVVLGLEARNKTSTLFPAYRLHAPESLVGIFDRTVLWWLNPLFFRGYRGNLSFEDLYSISDDLASSTLEQKFQALWERRANDTGRPLLRTVIRCLSWTFVTMAVPRLCLSALKLSQPLLIKRIVEYLSSTGQRIVDDGHGLIGATVLIYISLAITTVLYKRQLHRLMTKVRGILLAATHSHLLKTSTDKLSDKTVLTLMSTDVNRIGTSLQLLDNLFATPIEVAIAVFLLERQIGVACIAPAALSIGVSLASFLEIRFTIPLQTKWLKAVQERVAYTAAVLGCPKGFKMLGLTEYLTDSIQGLRIKELAAYADFRKIIALRNGFGTLPQALCPALAISVLAAISGGAAISSTTVFTSLALVALLSTPTQDFIFAVQMSQSALVSFDRIQDFLLDKKETTVSQCELDSADASKETLKLQPVHVRTTTSSGSDHVVKFREVYVNVGVENKEILHDINFTISRASLVMIVGPVGTGKTTLLRAIVGGAKISQGMRDVAENEFGYCAQESWLPNDSVRNLIVSHSEVDHAWYSRIIQVCALLEDIAMFPDGDDTIIGTHGMTLSGGQRQRISLARALYARNKVLVVDDVLSGLDARTSQNVFDQVFGPNGLCKEHKITTIFATHATQFLHGADDIICLVDGKIVEQGTLTQLDLENGYIRSLKLGRNDQHKEEIYSSAAPMEKGNDLVGLEDTQLDLARRTGDIEVYSYYAKSIGWKYGIAFVFTAISFAFGMKFSELWARWWSEASSSSQPLGLWIGVYFLLSAIAVASVFALVWVMGVQAVPRSSAQLHKQLLHAVMRAPYSFFAKTDAGVILNRFSNDMFLIESELILALMQSVEGASLCIGSAMLIAAGATYVGITIPFIIGILYAIQKFYLRTSRQLRFMDLEAQAPLITHCQETMSGITTIRAFGWQDQSHSQFLQLLDKSQRPYYLMLCIQRWLNLVLDLLTSAIATIVVAMAVTLIGSPSAGSIGVSLLNILTFNTQLAYLVTAWTTLETSLGAVARCRNFESSTASEDKPDENKQPPADWPTAGNLTFEDVTASYSNDGESVLKGISFNILPGEKVGICGRSGSGKSSLLLTLVHLLERQKGRVILDDVDLATLPRQAIRSRLSVIPQESVTFPGSWRNNLDPTNLHSSSDIRNALQKVGLIDAIEERGGLDSDLSKSALSQGQMQLFAIGRALLRPSKVVVLDEMTSSVDARTEDLIMALVRDEFRESTVIAVAHRLKTIIDFDKVLVMDKGRIVEQGPPRELLERDNGFLRAMWERHLH